MPLTAAYLAACRTAILALPELTTFRNARAILDTGPRPDRLTAWYAAFAPTSTGQSLAYQLLRAIRNALNAQGDATGNVTLLDRESAYRTFAAEFVPTINKPAEGAAELNARKILLGLQ